ncbi:DNA damage-repair/toleration protein DRT102 [Lycium ferocissimum]|uniref:DNA damage-repair/toleration protein DRT102 n=1 Tax=Lycium ferocissimum TaxID=112874 RepID=UPI002814A340|nr:DNA damage-repair/toleration protein DRT102 [Lycium ferocissimum]
MAQQSTKLPIKIITGADSNGCNLKDSLVSQLRSLNIEVVDLGTDKYYSIGEQIGRHVSQAANNPNPAVETRGLVACGTGVGVAIFANKFPGVYAATCLNPDEARNARSINNCNVLAVSGMNMTPEVASDVLKAFLETPFKSPCPASGSNPWPDEIDQFLDNSVLEMKRIGALENGEKGESGVCNLCSLVKGREFKDVDIMPGGSISIVRESPTAAFVRFTAGSVEPAHHHTFGHDLVVLKGSKRVWNLSKGEKYDLGVGDYLFTPAGDVHRVKYFEDTEFFIKWEGQWDLLLDEDHAAANAAIDKEMQN